MSQNRKLLLAGLILLIGLVGLVVFFFAGSSDGGSSSSGSGSSVAMWVAIMSPIWIAVANRKRKESED